MDSTHTDYTPRRVLPPHVNLGLKEMGLVAFGHLIKAITGDSTNTSLAASTVVAVDSLLANLKPLSLYENWSQLRLRPVEELDVDSKTAWAINR